MANPNGPEDTATKSVSDSNKVGKKRTQEIATLEHLLETVAQLDEKKELDGLRQVREQIVNAYPASDAAAEALYKIGLDALFRERNLDAAMEHFLAAIERKHAFWSAAARTSLGLCLYHQHRFQKALFELRKVAHANPPSSHSITALSFMEQIFMNEGQEEEAKRVRKDRIKQLELLVEQSQEQGANQEKGYYLFSLGVALLDQGEEDRAMDVLQKAKHLGPENLGAELYRSVVDILDQ